MYKIIFFLLLYVITFAQNSTDELGRKQGKWMQKHDNGNLRYEGTFLNDVPTGIFLYYNERGILKANLEYFNEGTSAAARLYHPNEKVSAVGVYENEEKVQLWKYYDQNGVLIRDEKFKAGKLHGEIKAYYLDGKLLESSNYTEGKQEGENTQYYRNGKLKLVSNYANGKLEGEYILYNSAGIKTYEGKYLNDLKEGIWKYYKSDGSFDYKIDYENGIYQTQENNE